MRSSCRRDYAAGEVYARAAASTRRACMSARRGARRGPTCASPAPRDGPRRSHPVHGHAEPAQERRHACSRRMPACARRSPDAPPLILAGASHAGIGPLGSAMRAAAAGGPRRASPATSTPRSRIELYARTHDAGAALVRRRLRHAGARGDGLRRAGGRLVARIAARSRGRRRRRRSIRTTPTAFAARDAGAARPATPSGGRTAALAQASQLQLGGVRDGGASAPYRPSRHGRFMRIAIDARELCGQPTGVGRYLRELLDRVGAQRRSAPAPRVDAARARSRRRMPSVAGHPVEVVARRWRHAVGAVRVARARSRRTSPTCSSRRRTLRR